MDMVKAKETAEMLSTLEPAERDGMCRATYGRLMSNVTFLDILSRANETISTISPADKNCE